PRVRVIARLTREPVLRDGCCLAYQRSPSYRAIRTFVSSLSRTATSITAPRFNQLVAQPRFHPSPLAPARPLPLERELVLDCVDVKERPQDLPFAAAFEQTLQTLEPAVRRGALAGITGHVAESVTELMLERLGWTPVWHFVGPGRHGVDLLMLGPSAERLFAVEVKGTLRPRQWPRLRRAELTQMAVEWLDKADNPAMSEWGVASEDVYGRSEE